MARSPADAAPALASEFGVGLGRAALATSGYALAYGLLQLVYGAMGNLLAVVAGSLDMLIAARVLSYAVMAFAAHWLVVLPACLVMRRGLLRRAAGLR